MRALSRYRLKRWSALLASVFFAFEPAAYAQYDETAASEVAPVQAQHAFSQQELDQMLAPIALYPDPLLSQILMAATYPLEVVEAARWSAQNTGLRGDAAVRAVQEMDWDPSVKSLVAFPQILRMMDEKLDWTERLGDAFLAQQSQVMDTIQNLRQRAYAAGNLRSNDRLRVLPEGQIIVVEPVNPDVVYVPYYDPTIYGSWWWPDYPPIYWAPWPDYYFGPGFAPGFAWGPGIVIVTGFFFGDCDWHHHRVIVANVNNFYYPKTVHAARNPARIVSPAPGVWRHDPDHRRGIPYREVTLSQQYGRTSASPGVRRDFRGYDQSSVGIRAVPLNPPSTGSAPVLTNRPETRVLPETRSVPEASRFPETRGGAGVSPSPRTVETRPALGGVTARQAGEHFQGAPSEPQIVSRPPVEVRPHALEDIGRGAEVRDFSSRGRASYEGTVRSQGGIPEQRPSGNVSTQRPVERESESRPSGVAPGGGILLRRPQER